MITASVTLPPEPRSPRVCRRFLVDTLAEWGADRFTDEAVLLVSELVTNAILHAATDIVVSVCLDGPLLRVEVSDGSTQMPSVRRYSLLSGTGRGLALVAATATSWDVEARPAGKTVWFELTQSHG